MAGKIEEDYANSFLEQSRLCLRDGDYHKAISFLGRAERLRPSLSGIGELMAISEVCDAAAWRCTCRLQAPKPKNPDWYRVLKVDEMADTVTIRKRYRQLALLLHPDKNKNVKAEEAFKLVSEAYACLSDRNSRKSFNNERFKSHCVKCYSGEPLPKRRSETVQPQEDYWKSEQEKLQMFREKARARVTSLTQDIRTRRSRWNADLETAREKYQNKRVDRKNMFAEEILRPLRESDVFQPGRKFAPESDLMSILRGRRSFQRDKSEVSQSLDGLLNRLRRDRSEKHRTKITSNLGEVVDTPESSKLPREGPQAAAFTDGHFAFVRDEAVQSSGVPNSNRASSAGEPGPGRKLFKDDGGEDFVRRQSFPIFDTKSITTPEENTFAADSSLLHAEVQSTAAATISTSAAAGIETTPVAHSRNARGGHGLRGNVVGDESNFLRAECAERTPLCCGSSRKSVLKEQRQKSEELMRTLERLRQEARSVAATLDKLKRRVDFTTADISVN